jgi:hypothetical protein
LQDHYGGDAAGFTLSTLLQLTDIRSNQPGMSLMHYVAQVYTDYLVSFLVPETTSLSYHTRVQRVVYQLVFINLAYNINILSFQCSQGLSGYLRMLDPQSPFSAKCQNLKTPSSGVDGFKSSGS